MSHIFFQLTATNDGLLYTGYNWPLVRTELVQNATGPRQRASGAAVMTAGRALVSWWSPRAGGEVAGPETSSGCSSVQLVPASRATASLTAAPEAFAGGQASLLGPLPHLSSLALQSAHSLLPPLSSHGAGVSRKIALRPKETSNFFVFLATAIRWHQVHEEE